MSDTNVNNLPSFETTSVHAGQESDPTTLATSVPIYRTTAFEFKNVEHATNLFALREFGNIYTRLMNPTTDILEKRVSVLEGGLSSVAVASGTSAIFYTIINIAKVGDEIISASNLYGGTYTMFNAILPDLGIKVNFANVNHPEEFEKLINVKTRLIFIETIGNPVLDMADIDQIATIAKKHHLPLVVDGSFTSPALLQSIQHGADVVINSLTKWMGGHGNGIGGIATDAGTFDWSDPKFDLYNQGDKNYHGLRWAHDLPTEIRNVAFSLRFRTVPLRNTGACISPDNAWSFLQGITTLPLRMEKHCQNAFNVAQYLQNHPQVAWVRYPGLKEDPSYPLAIKYLHNGFGGIVVFGIKGGAKNATTFIESLRLFLHVANFGDVRSLAMLPSVTSHSQLSEEQQIEAGLQPDLIRLSVGIEDINDIQADLEQAFHSV